MSNNEMAQEIVNIAPSKQEKLAGALLYLVAWLGDAGFAIFIALGLISTITDLPYFLRFHFAQAIRNGMLAGPIILFLIAPALIDSFIAKISNTVMYTSFAIAGLFALCLIIIDIYCVYYAAKGEMRNVLPLNWIPKIR